MDAYQLNETFSIGCIRLAVISVRLIRSALLMAMQRNEDSAKKTTRMIRLINVLKCSDMLNKPQHAIIQRSRLFDMDISKTEDKREKNRNAFAL